MTSPSLSKSLRLAIQRSGRLSESSLELIAECGIAFNRNDNRLKAHAYNFPIEFLYIRDDDIPEYVADGAADVGIVGLNVVLEKRREVEIIERLGISKCRLSIALPKSIEYRGIEDLNGLHIATSYPNSLKSFLTERGVRAQIREVSGSTEIAPSIGLADAVCDLVSSGSTLVSNGLREVEVVLESEAVLIRSRDLDESKSVLLDKFLFRVQSVLKARDSKYILLNVRNESIPAVTKLLPGLKSPTVLPLAEEGWSSIHSVINENEFWDVIEGLRDAGAEGILVVPIQKMIC